MVLVDSCVWIDALKGRETPAVRKLKSIQEAKAPEICISSIIYFEVLRGFNSDLERKRVQKGFDLLEKRDFLPSGFDRLAALFVIAQKQGIMVARLGDWLILKTVLDHSLTLLTSDRDFVRLQKVIPFPLELSPEGS